MSCNFAILHAVNYDLYDVASVFHGHGWHVAGVIPMSRRKKGESAQASNVFQFTLAGLIIFSLALVAGASFVGYKLASKNTAKSVDAFAVDPNDKSRSAHTGPWGVLMERNIQLERPVEFLSGEVDQPQPEVWTFNGLNPGAVKTLLSKNGLTAAQVAAVCASGNVRDEKSGTVLTPSADFLLSLDAATRGKLYAALACRNVNVYFGYPFIFPGDSIESIYADTRLNPVDAALLKRLVYANGGAKQLSDYELLLCQIPTLERRVAMSRSLSRQSAVFAGLVIKPDTDIDKIAAYWSAVPNVRFTDIRPLLESLKALPEGGNLSLFYLLPKFARDRLYTFPLPSQPGDPVMDCHWTTFNFSSDTPDNRFNDPEYTIEYINKKYYQISAPSMYGDILLLLNDKKEIKHSAVFLADDLVFTKNGNNYRQPWMLMHIPDLLATYPATPAMKPVYMRLKTQ
jgi:hypothetical protein